MSLLFVSCCVDISRSLSAGGFFKKEVGWLGGGGEGKGNSPRTAFCIPVNARPSSQIGQNLEAINPKSSSEIETK